MKNIWICFGFSEARKTKRLIRRLGYKGFWCLVKLLEYVGRERPDGVLTELDKVAIAEEAGWIDIPFDEDYIEDDVKKSADRFVRALVDSGWVEYGAGEEFKCYWFPTFRENNPHLDREKARQRSERATRGAKKRWGKVKSQQPKERPAPAKKPVSKAPSGFSYLEFPVCLDGLIFNSSKMLEEYIKKKFIGSVGKMFRGKIKELTKVCVCGQKFVTEDESRTTCLNCMGGEK